MYTRSQNFSFYFSLFALYFAALVPFSESLNRIALYVLLPAAFLLSFMTNLPYSSRSIKISPNRYFKLLIILYLWIAFTGLFASDQALVFRQFRQLLGCVLISYLFSCHIMRRDGSTLLLYITYLIFYGAVFYYAINNVIEIIDFGNDERLIDSKLNANEFAYFTFCLTFSLFIISEIVKEIRISVLFRILFILTIPLSFYVALMSASRQVLILQIPLISFLIYFRYFKNTTTLRKIVFIIIAASVFVLSWTKVKSIYDDSFLKQRNEKSIDDEARKYLIVDAFKVGVQHPIVGVGPGNYILYSYRHQFSHCSYTELFANDGLPGIIIYLYILIYFCVAQLKRYRQYRDTMFLYFLVFGIMFMVAQMFYVYYIALWLIGFFMLVASHSEAYYKRISKGI